MNLLFQLNSINVCTYTSNIYNEIIASELRRTLSIRHASFQRPDTKENVKIPLVT